VVHHLTVRTIMLRVSVPIAAPTNASSAPPSNSPRVDRSTAPAKTHIDTPDITAPTMAANINLFLMRAPYTGRATRH